MSTKSSPRGPLFRPVGPALFRAPALPLERYLSRPATCLSTCVGSDHTCACWSTESRARAAGDPIEAFDDPRLGLALLVGSRSAFDGRERAARGGRIDDRLRGKLLRYLIRMSTRPTPYGLFAGVALAHFGQRTNLKLGPSPPRRRSRPDMAWLMALAARLESRPEVRRHLRLVANPTAQVRAGRIVVMERFPRTAGAPTSEVSVRATGAVRQALLLAREPLPFDVLQDRLVEATGADRQRALKLLDTLWEQTFLLTDLTPSFTSMDPARRMADRLAGIEEASEEWAALSSLLNELASWDALDDADAIPTYLALADRAKAVGEPFAETPFQVDLAFTLSGNEVHQSVADEIARAAELLLRLSPHPDGPPALTALREAFVLRYNEGLELPLLELLDPNLGLGPLGSVPVPPVAESSRRTRRDQILLDLASQAVRTGQRIVELDEPIMAGLQTWSPDPFTAPLTLDLCVQVAARSASELDAGAYQIVVGPNVGADAAGRYLGRFAYLFDREGVDALRAIARAEDALTPGVLAVELVYRPRLFRPANVTVRPAVRPHEIHLDGSPEPDGVTSVPLDQLVVGVRDGRFYLRWRGDDREVRITSSHMLNSTTAPEVVRFLSEVGQDGRAQLEGFDWGPAEGFPYLPRVQSGRVVLRPAEWRISPDVVRREFTPGSIERFREDLVRWRTTWNVPRRVFLVAADNRLLLDLDDDAQTAELYHEVRRVEDARLVLLQEVLPDLDQVWVEGPGGRQYAELVVPLGLAQRPASASIDLQSSPVADLSPSTLRIPLARRSPMPSLKPPGSEWLYMKVYCGPSVHDDLIAGPLREFAGFVVAEGMAACWHFIRYADPDPHLRVRFRGDPGVLSADLLPAACVWASRMLESGYSKRFAFDTYDREVERYGGRLGIDIAESVFSADSASVATYLNLVARGTISLDKIALAVVTVDRLLEGLGLSEADRYSWLKESVTRDAEVGADYRKRQPLLRAHVGESRGRDANARVDPLKAATDAARLALEPSAERLADLSGRAELTQPLASLYGSFVHMHLNRLIGIDRAAESRVLGLLFRTAQSLRQAPRAGAIGPAATAAANAGDGISPAT